MMVNVIFVNEFTIIVKCLFVKLINEWFQSLISPIIGSLILCDSQKLCKAMMMHNALSIHIDMFFKMYH
jgi:hypothetical protein